MLVVKREERKGYNVLGMKEDGRMEGRGLRLGFQWMGREGRKGCKMEIWEDGDRRKKGV